MKKIPALFLSICLTFSLSSVMAQAPLPATAIPMPQVIPVVGDPAGLGKYGDVPVGMTNGQANISVPLYEIKTPRLSLPIGLNYATSGLKVDDIASWVGMEWSLNAGGMITRTVRGLDDFAAKGYYNSTIPLAANVTPQNSWKFFGDALTRLQDSEPDIFFFNFGQYSGKFILNQNKVPTILNYQSPLKVQYTGSSFQVTDGQGNNYYFNTPETMQANPHGGLGIGTVTYTSTWYLSRIVSNDRTDTINFTYFSDLQYGQSTFNYAQTVGSTYTTGGAGVCGYSLQTGYSDGTSNVTNQPTTFWTPQRLKEIDFKNGKVVFYSSLTRIDLTTAGPSGGVRMDSVIVSSYDYPTATYIPIKKIKAGYGNYFTNISPVPINTVSAYHLRLDSLNTFGGDNSFGGTYKFLYDSTMIPYYQSTGKDLFGYYNGKNTNAGLIPLQLAYSYGGSSYTIGAADRSTDSTYIQAGILKWLYYPTGGYTHFTYEANRYQGSYQNFDYNTKATGSSHQADSVSFSPTSNAWASITINFSPFYYGDVHTRPYVLIKNLTTGQTTTYTAFDASNGSISAINYFVAASSSYRIVTNAFDDNKVTAAATIEWQQYDGNTVLGGGLRIKQITDYDYTGRFVKSEFYKYGVAESGFGFLPSPSFLLNTNNQPRTIQYGCSGVAYQCGAGVVSSTRMSFSASSIYDIFSLAGSPISYSEVAKYQVDSLGNNIGKSIFDFSVYQNTVVPGSTAYGEALYITNSGWMGGQQTQQRDYAWKSGVFWPVKQTGTGYTLLHQQQGRGLKIGYIKPPLGGSIPIDSNSIVPCFTNVYYYFDYPIYAGSTLPAIETTRDYDMNDSTKWLSKTKTMNYDTAAMNLESIVTTETRSDSAITTVNSYYPEEISSLTGLSAGETAAIDSMIAQHNISTLLQANNYNGSSQVNITKHHVGLWNTHMALPASLEIQNGAFPTETRMQFLNYDAVGNIQLVAKSADLKMRYIWDYKASLPIAEIKNASDTCIAYTSFEADGTGGWTVPDTLRVRTNSITGAMSYNLSGKSISKSLITGQPHVLSYWSTNGSLTVTQSGISVPVSLTGLKKNGWSYYEHLIPSTATALNITATSAIIDELRLYPQGALMASYTYQPLAGITTSTSTGSLVSYYEYDGLNRLKTTRDIDRNIIKTYDYQYRVSPHTFYNTATLLNYTRNNCAICLVGSTVSYTVPAGMFSSLISQGDAQSQAIAYGNVVGQAYANANGTCGSPAIAPITATNSTTSTIMIAFVNNCTGHEYDFRLGTSTGTNWNTVPQGTYTVSIGGGTATTTYHVNGFTQTGTSASFGSVPFVSGYNYFTVN